MLLFTISLFFCSNILTSKIIKKFLKQLEIILLKQMMEDQNNQNQHNGKRIKTFESFYYQNLFNCAEWISNWCKCNYYPKITGSSLAKIIGLFHHKGEGFAGQRPSSFKTLVKKTYSNLPSHNTIGDLQKKIQFAKYLSNLQSKMPVYRDKEYEQLILKRLKASEVCNRKSRFSKRQQSINEAKNFLRPPTMMDYATFWGRQMEWRVGQMLQNAFKLEPFSSKSTLNICHRYYSKIPSISASCDGVVRNACLNKPKTLIEIKCPYNGRIPKIIRINDYLQMLVEMSCYQVDNIIYVCWCPSGFSLWYIEYDKRIWEMIEKHLVSDENNYSFSSHQQRKQDDTSQYLEWTQSEILATKIRISIEHSSKKIGYYIDRNQYNANINTFYCTDDSMLTIKKEQWDVEQMKTQSIFQLKYNPL